MQGPGDRNGLTNSFRWPSEMPQRLETEHRRIQTALPAPTARERLDRAADSLPEVSCYQVPVIWDRAEGYQVYDNAGNCWIDFSSTAVMANTGHGHPRVREAIVRHASEGLLAQFSFHSDLRTEVAQDLLALAPAGMTKVYFWTTGSEAIEAAFRVSRQWAMGTDARKTQIVSLEQDYHGCTLAAHQLSGNSSAKSWLPAPDVGIHRLPFLQQGTDPGSGGWDQFVKDAAGRAGLVGDEVAAVIIETFQGWGALQLEPAYVQALARWLREHGGLLIFDEVQTGFGRTGKMWGHQHYDVVPDLICIGKGITSTLPLAAVMGAAEVLDVLPPGEVTTTHAGHPLSLAAARENLAVLREEGLVQRAANLGELVKPQLESLQAEFPRVVEMISGTGLLWAIHLKDPETGEASEYLARQLVWESVKRGVMLFHTNRATVKVCPPLIIPEAALLEGIRAIRDALAGLV